ETSCALCILNEREMRIVAGDSERERRRSGPRLGDQWRNRDSGTILIIDLIERKSRQAEHRTVSPILSDTAVETETPTPDTAATYATMHNGHFGSSTRTASGKIHLETRAKRVRQEDAFARVESGARPLWAARSFTSGTLSRDAATAQQQRVMLTSPQRSRREQNPSCPLRLVVSHPQPAPLTANTVDLRRRELRFR